MVERFGQRLEIVEQRLGVAASATLELAPDSAATEQAQSGPAKKSTGRRSKKTETDQPGQPTS